MCQRSQYLLQGLGLNLHLNDCDCFTSKAAQDNDLPSPEGLETKLEKLPEIQKIYSYVLKGCNWVYFQSAPDNMLCGPHDLLRRHAILSYMTPQLECCHNQPNFRKNHNDGPYL
jgi:hypothetical protein